MMYGGDPGFAFEYGGSWADWRDNHQHMMPVTEYIGTKLPKERLPFRQEFAGGGSAGLPAVGPETYGWDFMAPKSVGPREGSTGSEFKDAVIERLVPDLGINYRSPKGWSIGAGPWAGEGEPSVDFQFRKKFNQGGFNKGRRNFLKLMAGLASIPVVGKFFKAAKPAAKAVKAVETSNAAGMPAWFPKLVDKVIKDGKDVTKQYGTIEREIVHIGELPNSKTKIMVTQDLTTGNTAVDIGMGKHGFSDGRYGQPVRLELNKGEWIEPTHIENIKKGSRYEKTGKPTKTKDEFWVEEAEFTGGHPENIKFEESSIERYGDHASDFSELELYATGKNVDKYNLKGTKKAKSDEWAQGRAEIEAEQIDEFAKGGLAHMLGR